MKILIACEYSGVVREAFAKIGHDAVSCDLLPTEIPGKHHTGSIEDVLDNQWDLVIAFPPCTHLSSSGARWWPEKQQDGRQQEAEQFFLQFTKLPCKWAIENPVGRMSTVYRKPDQIIQPWQHGHGETKATCLWLNGLPKLTPTNIVDGREARIHRMAPGPDRAKERSRTYLGIAKAMAEQWQLPGEKIQPDRANQPSNHDAPLNGSGH